MRVPALEASFALTRTTDDPSAWTVGRAGMLYRDLIDGGQGGRFVGSHIRIPDGGPVGDWVHYHLVRFQVIYCYRGWVRVVYEDQGPPFVLEAGDCVLQPPTIRHRVLECSPGLEVVELTCPAEHETRADETLALPTPDLRPDRDFSGQRFVRHVAREAQPTPWRVDGWTALDTGIAQATAGLATVRTARPSGPTTPPGELGHDGELVFLFQLEGASTVGCEGEGAHVLREGDAVVVPPRRACTLTDPTTDAALLEVALPAPSRSSSAG